MPERPKKFDSSGEIKKMIKVLSREGSEGSEEEPMRDWQTLSHVKWDCKYHIIFVTKYKNKKGRAISDPDIFLFQFIM